MGIRKDGAKFAKFWKAYALSGLGEGGGVGGMSEDFRMLIQDMVNRKTETKRRHLPTNKRSI